MSRPTRTGTTAVLNAERDSEILSLKAQGWTLAEIGDLLGLHASTIHRIIDVRVKAVTKLAAETYIAAELARLQRMEDATIAQAYGTRYEKDDKGNTIFEPMFSNDGDMVLKPDGTPMMVPRISYSENNNGKAVLLKIQDLRIRLLGIAAPAKLITSNINTNNPPPALTFKVIKSADGRPIGAEAVQAHGTDPDSASDNLQYD